jgi:DNA (cytosine-5)-methyltransferase 1
VAEILRRKQPKGIFLENVKGLKIHDHGKTFEVIKNTLAEVGYVIAEDPAIVNAMDFGVPQHRERVYIIGVRRDIAEYLGITQDAIQNSYPKPTDSSKRFRDIKEKNEVSVKYYLSTQYMQTLINHKARHAAKGNGFGYEIVHDDQVANAIVVGGMGRERNLVIDQRLTNFNPVTHIKGVVNHDGIRRMTPREWARLQGYPDNFIIPVADASAYKQFGNSVAVPAIQATAEKLLELLNIN